jgi:hypothetical protein
MRFQSGCYRPPAQALVPAFRWARAALDDSLEVLR